MISIADEEENLRWSTNWRKQSQLSVIITKDRLVKILNSLIPLPAELTVSEGMEDQFEIVEMDDETYSGILVYKPFGDYTELPMMSC